MRSNTRSSVLATALASGCLVAALIGLSRRGDQHSVQEIAVTRSANQDEDDVPAVFRLHPLPRITLRPRSRISEAQTQRIEICIARLAEVDHPDYGYARTITGVRFLPLPDQTDAFGWAVTNHELAPSDALRDLVEIGPAALPALLRHLSDTTPTRLQILPISLGGPSGLSLLGGMSYSNELAGNPANPHEIGLPPLHAWHHFNERGDLDEHQLKIGDLCFVAIGQIVGRLYVAVRYQRTSCVVVNSPTLDQTLCDRVRQIWNGNDPELIVFESLLRDFVTEEISDEPSRGSDDVLSDYQLSAAMRLLYYFPRESAGLVADRLRRLRVVWPAEEEADIRSRFVSAYHPSLHMDRVKEFVKRVAWCPIETVRREVRRIFHATTSLEIALAALPAVAKESPKAAQQRVVSLVRSANGSIHLHDVVAALVQAYGHEALVILPEIFREATPDQLHWFCVWNGDTTFDANDRLLGLLLTDQRSTEPDRHGKTFRVCDAAASALSEINKNYQFKSGVSVAERNLQIERLREQLRTELPR